MARFEFDYGVIMPIFIGLLIFLIFFLFGAILGQIAKNKGRSFWGHSIINTIFIIICTAIGVVSGFWMLPLIVYVISLLIYMAEGKTDKMRRQEIEEEERIRQQIRSRYERREPSYPAERPAPSKEDHERYMPNPKGKTINDLYRD